MVNDANKNFIFYKKYCNFLNLKIKNFNIWNIGIKIIIKNKA